MSIQPRLIEPGPTADAENGCDLIRITGGKQLPAGVIKTRGAPEAALVLLAAAATTRRSVTLTPVPTSSDVQAMRGLIATRSWSVTSSGSRVQSTAESLATQNTEADLGAAGLSPHTDPPELHPADTTPATTARR